MDGETSSMDGSVIGECHPWMENPHLWMKMIDDRHGQSLSSYEHLDVNEGIYVCTEETTKTTTLAMKR